MRLRNQNCPLRMRLRKIGAAIAIPMCLVFFVHGCGRSESVVPETKRYERLTNADTIETVRRFCGDCHPVPSPASFPRGKWPAEVERGYKFYYDSGRTDLKEPVVNDTIRYYQSEAAERLDVLSAEAFPIAESSIQFVPSPLVTADEPTSLTSHILWEEQTKSLLLSDMATGKLRRWNHLSVPGIRAMRESEHIVLDSSSVIANGKNLCRINVCVWN